MRTKHTGLYILFLGMMVLFLANCAPQLSQLPPSPEKTYAQSLTIYNNANEAYIVALMLQDPETKAQWKRDINPKLDAADVALNAWWNAIGTDRQEGAQFNYLQLWHELFPVLFELGIIEVEE